MRPIFIGLIGLVWVLTAGCQSAAPKADEREASARALLGSAAARAVPMFRGDTGSPIAWGDLVARAVEADVVTIGELHGHPLGSAAAAAFWEDVLAAPGVAERAALAMEFFDRSEQPSLDDYVTGLTDEAVLFVGNHLSYTGNPFGHRAMMSAAKTAGVSVIGANSPRIYVRTARTAGYERLAALTPEQRRLFRIPDQVPGRDVGYRKRFDEFMLGGGAGQTGEAGTAIVTEPTPEELGRVEAGFRSQSLWDWTMAESVARAVDSGRRPVVLVVGQFHTNHDGGLLLALRSLRPGTPTLTVAFIGEDSRVLRDEDRGAADVVVYTGGVAGAAR